MQKNHSKWTLTMLAGAISTAVGLAAEPTLKVGDPAPKLQTGKWVQGGPITDFKKGKAYIVEFWATWCGPCRVSIPHLNELHTKYKDKGLIVIGQDCWERDESLVKPFIEKMGDKMTYAVALDDKEGNETGKMAETWMVAAGRNGIPSAFLVDTKGLIAWIGHPMQLKDAVIEAVLEGKFDVKKAAAEEAEQAKNQAALRTAWREMQQAMQNKEWDTAEAKLKEAEKLLPADERGMVGMSRFNILLEKKDFPAAQRLAEKLSDENKDNAMMQNELAWQILTFEGMEKRDLKLAEKIARRGDEAAKGKNPAVIDTLARALYMRGEKTKAIELQEKAVGLADGIMKTKLEKILESYKKGELPDPN